MKCSCGHKTGQTCLYDFNKMKLFSKEWFNACFEGVNVSPEIKKVTEYIVSAYQIEGISDPGHIANTIAHALAKS